MKASEFAMMLAVVLLLLYVLWSLLCHRRSPEIEDDGFEEPFANGDAMTSPPPAATPTPVVTDGGGPLDMQAVIDFSDVIVTPEQRAEWKEHVDNTKQIQTVNERFKAAKRRTEEYRLKPGVYTNKKRRQLIETLVRRPYCGRRARAWRTAFSDTMRGDVVPKNLNQGQYGMMRIGRRDPKVDLHPGALGPMSGLSGAWVSEENLPDNLFDDTEAVIVE